MVRARNRSLRSAMYKTFLSWRYMRARRTNLIGVIGIGVGVGALIMILSIMTGFLEETKSSVRGGLADLVIEPVNLPNGFGRVPPYDPAPILKVVRSDPHVLSACAQLSWFGILGRSGQEAQITEARM